MIIFDIQIQIPLNNDAFHFICIRILILQLFVMHNFLESLISDNHNPYNQSVYSFKLLSSFCKLNVVFLLNLLVLLLNG